MNLDGACPGFVSMPLISSDKTSTDGQLRSMCPAWWALGRVRHMERRHDCFFKGKKASDLFWSLQCHASTYSATCKLVKIVENSYYLHFGWLKFLNSSFNNICIVVWTLLCAHLFKNPRRIYVLIGISNMQTCKFQYIELGSSKIS